MTAPEQTETLEQQIARLTAERDALAAAATTTATTTASTADAPAAPAGLAFGDLVRREFRDYAGNPRVGLAFVTGTIEPYEQADGTMSERLYLLAPLEQTGAPVDTTGLSKLA